MLRIFIFFIIFACAINAQESLAQNASKALTLEQYLDQVRGGNGIYSASDKREEAYKLLQKKANLVTAPTFFASAETGYNEQITALPFFRYNRIATQNYSAGISQNSAFGVNSKFTYALNKIHYNGLDTSNPLAVSNYQTRPVLELTIPLLQGRFGSLTRASRDLIDSQNEAQKFSAQSASVTVLIEAEQGYWRLAAAKKIIEIQRMAVKQAQKILEYVKKKEVMNLGERADVLQATALVETKKLELRQAENDARYASLLFNRNRHIDSDLSLDELDAIDFSRIDSAAISAIKPGSRPDVKAAKSNMNAAIAAAKVEEENNTPSLNLYGSYAFKGVQYGATDAMNNAFTARGKEGLVGVKFSVPFYIGDVIDIQKGAKINAQAARDEYRQRAFNEENDWKDLTAQIAYYKERVNLARAIEAAQKSKLENERSLLRQGRTSTYQVLLFEQEYSQSQINTIASASQFLSLLAQKKLYIN